MLRIAAALSIVVAVAGCDDVAVKTFADATQDVNEGFALGKKLRDRCASTGNVDHCKAWLDYKRAEEAQVVGLSYEKALARWEANGPY